MLKNNENQQKMQCPYFKKINFQKIVQLNDIEDDYEKNNNLIPVKRDIFSFEDSIPQEGSTNKIKIQNYRKVNRGDTVNNTIDDDFEETNKIITIKMPRTLEIKQFNIQFKQPSTNRLNFKSNPQNDSSHNFIQKQDGINLDEVSQQVQQQLSLEERQCSQPKTARIFQTHRNLFFFQNNFFSIITLQAAKEQYMCHLNGTILKILTISENNLKEQIFQTEQNVKNKNKYTTPFLQLKQQAKDAYKHPKIKVKYFIDLSKYKTQLIESENNVLQLVLLSKGSRQKIQMNFKSPYQRCSFECVYESVMEYIQQGLQKQNKQQAVKQQESQSYIESSICSLNSERSIDSLKFSVQRIKYKDASSFLSTFDIILFKGKNIMSKVQRLLTNSDFDHVGLILKTVSDNLLLLQATGNVGVAMYTFSSLKRALKKKLYERIAIRKYTQSNIESRTQRAKKLLVLQDFISQVNGKKYKFDPLYLISNSIKKKSGMSLKISDQQQTFFCSQLVAQALKVCKIMKQQKPSYKFLPKHFADVEGLNMEMKQGHLYSNLIVLEY